MSQSPHFIRTISLCISFLLLSFLSLSAQQLSLEDFNQDRKREKQTAMLVLGGWAVANIGTGLIMRNQVTGADKHFYEMNAYWNTVNLGIAAFGYFGALRTDPAALDAFTTMNEHHSFQKILLFNAGLDVGYILGGLYLTERAKRPDVNTDRLKGFGHSIMLQGGFLLAFDLLNYFIQASHNDQLELFVNGSGGIGMRWVF